MSSELQRTPVIEVTDLVLQKAATGIKGLDELTGGGLPRGRPTLVCGGAGSGKTLFAMEFLVHGAREMDEPGLFVAFEETPEELKTNVASLGFDLNTLIANKKLAVDYIYIQPTEIEETGDYDLEGLFIRLGTLIDSISARRIVLDTIETLFSGFTNQAILRGELRRLFRWLKDRGVTALVTAERSPKGQLTRHGLEEYVSDAVIELDHRVIDQVATRRLRVVKYRGSRHGTNEYPFLIDEHGISVLPVTSLGLNHRVSEERVSTGVSTLDSMLGGGYYRGSSVLVSGTAGTGKTSLAAHLADECCKAGGRCLYFAFEESVAQIVRNMKSIGIDLQKWIDAGLLRFQASRPTLFGLEMHLLSLHNVIRDFEPTVTVLDPITNLMTVGATTEVKSMLTRLIDMLKNREVTAFFTSLTHPGEDAESSAVGISSLMDTWLMIKYREENGERTRTIEILKSRGMKHSNQIREFLLTEKGVQLVDVYLGEGRVMTGSARAVQEARERVEAGVHDADIERRKRELERKKAIMEANIVALRASFESDEEEL